MTLLDKSLRDFLATLAARTPTPGGGSVAALNAALGLGLVAMAARFTTGKKHEAVEADALKTAESCDALRARAAALVDEDAGAYDAVSAAYALPKATDAEKGIRAAAIEKALAGAMAVPERTIAVSLDGLEQARAFAPKSNRNLASDVFVGACCLFAAVEGGRANVRINAGSMADPAKAKPSLAAADDSLSRAASLLASVRDAVEPSFPAVA